MTNEAAAPLPSSVDFLTQKQTFESIESSESLEERVERRGYEHIIDLYQCREAQLARLAKLGTTAEHEQYISERIVAPNTLPETVRVLRRLVGDGMERRASYEEATLRLLQLEVEDDVYTELAGNPDRIEEFVRLFDASSSEALRRAIEEDEPLYWKPHLEASEDVFAPLRNFKGFGLEISSTILEGTQAAGKNPQRAVNLLKRKVEAMEGYAVFDRRGRHGAEGMLTSFMFEMLQSDPQTDEPNTYFKLIRNDALLDIQSPLTAEIGGVVDVPIVDGHLQREQRYEVSQALQVAQRTVMLVPLDSLEPDDYIVMTEAIRKFSEDARYQTAATYLGTQFALQPWMRGVIPVSATTYIRRALKHLPDVY